ncbi:MAG TPA: hypothetical protein VNM37_09850, partial [Candidatus Dormibacteraeota bacterium]|nr:hypothetical protein [Candidatus Dormibacteraeota bacterium]
MNERGWKIESGGGQVQSNPERFRGWRMAMLLSAFCFQLSAFAQTPVVDWRTVDGGYTIGAPAERIYQTAVWTGSELIVWGGLGGDFFY